MKPMLLCDYPDKTELINSQKNVYLQPKLDGWRAVANLETGEIFTRSGKKLNLPHLSEKLIELGKVCDEKWADGELYKHGSTLGEIQSMIRTSSPEIEFHIFDFVSEKDYGNRYLRKINKGKLFKIIAYSKIKFVNTEVRYPEEAIEYYENCLEQGYEGAVVRINGEGYDHYRSSQVIKIKPELVYRG